MKLGPFTFQCACFICIWRSTASASRWFISVFSSNRRWSEMSFSVSYILGASAWWVLDEVINRFLLGMLVVNFVLRPIVKPMRPREFAFRAHFRLRRQPVLHFAARQRTLVLITEGSPARHLRRRRREINFVLLRVRRRWPGRDRRRLILGMIIMFH